ncbi:alpha/beta fold hydrolase [Planomonospora venezuelensis]|uniref:Pimeloyl-ACP methyl ester carboxylesterase n=1 Tax=Planomonospora venezuelensis TaxID=1999 RepID=A0A841CT01_PLAVE|nr:pimeloyl-ACP methyl ester carboxylesterase [Planomonospora venezuelensis]
MTIFLEETGPDRAPAVVLLHGAGAGGWMWKRQAEALRDAFRVLVPDLPGHGRSNAVAWESVADTAEHIAEMIRKGSGTGRAHVVGLSLGGYLAAHLAATRPDVVETAVVSGVNVLPFPRPAMMRFMGRAMAPLMTWGPMINANARALRVPPEDRDAYREAARAMSRAAFLRIGDELMDFRVPPEAADSPCPLLAVAGEREQDLILRSLPHLAGSFPAGKAWIVPGVGHGWNGETPDLFAAMVRAHAAGENPPQSFHPVPAT